jgi:formylglycine-generating enzyme required for sulfatase activity
MAALSCDPALATWTDSPGANETRPMNCVTWYEAFAFCAWDGARLATEAEWNYAASGGSEQRVYPWSSPPSSTFASWSDASYYVDGTQQCMGDGVAGCTIADLIAVGTKPLGMSRWGAHELAGNVWEWVLDVYSNPYSIVSCTDCATLSGSSNRVIRGGSFFGSPATIPASNRSISQPDQRLFSVGIRCVR